MKTQISHFKFQILFPLVLAGVAAADLPVKPPLARYSALWEKSVFTAKPPEPDAPTESNIFEDYSLLGVTSIGDNGHRVTMIDKKKPEERIIVDSDNPKSDFQIVKVIRKPGDPLGTVVIMKSGNMEGTVSFNESLLTLATAAPPKVANPQPVPPGGASPVPNPQNPNMPPGSRLPRPRVLPPPNPQAVGQPQPNQPTPQPPRPIRHGH